MHSTCTMVAMSVLDVGKGRSINSRSLNDDRDAERVNSGLIGVVAIPGIS